MNKDILLLFAEYSGVSCVILNLSYIFVKFMVFVEILFYLELSFAGTDYIVFAFKDF